MATTNLATSTAENILQLITQLPAAEQQRLRELWLPASPPHAESAAPAQTETNHEPATPAPAPPKAPRDRRLPAEPMPDGTREMRWLAEHQRAYAGQWVALDGDRLIAAGSNHDEVWAAARADGARLPLITLVEDPDNIVHFFWT